ncbi:TonB-linked SusC/RagA family outer membrane protein [Chitinophaga niastensis]|uniref:TonB-linked SusC/RagA family outer membrane protein n=1 Tax=Chitinophaga niastensis TaxID=536980 RepID=A0A2P8HTW2_CHINA|nr:TonB-dependent receptor [Chitinophaga niastensis]PSL49625.1 TonB-linked SusC/RagA family outer membrane protein [Chitinophaga niastensis]
MKKALLLWLIAAISVIQAHAQTRPITGKVTDLKDGAALPGVTVKVKNTNTGTTTNSEGTFTLNVKGNPVLEFTFVGFATKEVATTGKDHIDIKLGADEKALSEVVVVAYGTTKKGSNTSASTQIDSKKFATRPISNIASALDGAAPGIQTNAGSGQPGDGPTIRIRGFGSVNASSDPLYVVDGVPYSGNLSSLNVADIESVSVLKDASSSSLYGSRAANGVIIVTTKKGKKGRNQLQVSVVQGINSRGIPEYSRTNAQQYYPLMWESFRNSLLPKYSRDSASKIASGIIPMASGSIKDKLGYNPFNVADNAIVGVDGTLNPNAQLLYPDDVDWTKAVTRNGGRGEYGLSYSGGTEKTDYFASLNYLNDKGYVINSDFQRISGRVNVNTQATDWFRTGLNVAGTFVKSNQTDVSSSTGYVNPIFFARNIGPIYPVYQHDATGAYILDNNGERLYDIGGSRGPGASPGRNTVAENYLNDNSFNRNVLSARTFGEVSFLRNFKFTTNISVDVANSRSNQFYNTLVGDGAPGGLASRTSTQTTSYTLNQLLNYNRTFDKHNVDVLVGHENYDMSMNSLYGERQSQVAPGNTELYNFTTTNNLYSFKRQYRTEGYFSRVNYGYDEKYFLSGSIRHDGTSRFYADNRWGNFYSVGGGWRMDKENFLKSVSWINMLKLRSSYGTAGNDAVLDDQGSPVYYVWQSLYQLGYNNALEPGVFFTKMGNTSIQWEANKSFDVGADFALFNNRLTGSIEYFTRKSDNLLFELPLPLSSGISSKTSNVGTMVNRGVELQLTGEVMHKKDFSWTVDLNLSKLKNELTRLPQSEIISSTKKLMVGHSIYDYWLRQWYGVDPADGAALYVANSPTGAGVRTMKNGDIVTTNINNAKYHYAGSAIPDFYGSITNTFNYKQFQLSFLLSFQLGGKVYDATYASLMNTGSYGAALHTDALNRWQKPGDITNVPRMDQGQTTNFNASLSDRWLTSASFLNFRSIKLGYTVPESYAKAAHMRGANVFLSGENLALFSARKGMNVSQAFSGVTSNVYMPARIISAGLNITL